MAVLEFSLVHELVTTFAADIGDRVHDAVLPPNAVLPAVVWQRVSSPPEELASRDGYGNRVRARIQLMVWSATTAEARLLANRIKAHLKGFVHRHMGVGGASCATFVLDAQPVGGRDLPEPSSDARRVLLEFMFEYIE